MSLEVPTTDRLVLTRYLLGQLSPADLDQVEERFEDTAYFAEYQEVVRLLVQSYAAGTMDPTEADLFARNYLVTKRRRDQVAIVRALLEVHTSRPSIQPARSASVRKWIPVFAMAASLIIAAVVWNHSRPPAPVETALLRPVEPTSIPYQTPAPPPPTQETAPALAPEPTPAVPPVDPVTAPPPAHAPAKPPPPAPATPPARPATPSFIRTPSAPRAASAVGRRADQPARPAGGNKILAPVEQVINMANAGMSESLIIKSLQAQNKPATLSAGDLAKLQAAGVSESIISAMIDPKATSVPVALLALAPPPPPVSPVRAVPVGDPGQADLVKTVLADEFDYSAVKTEVQAIFNTQQNIGKGIRAMLEKRMREQGKVVVLSGSEIRALTIEQRRDADNRSKQGVTAPIRIGRVAGVNAILAGDIVIFGHDDKKRQVRGGGVISGAIGSVANMSRDDQAVVVIDYRLIDAETSAIIAVGEARGESVRKSSGFGGMLGGTGKGAKVVEVDMTSPSFAQTIIGEAITDCVNKLADILNKQAEEMRKTVREVQTLVTDVSGNTLVIAAGTNDGVNTGDVFEIHEVVREVKDPTTKEVLDRITNKVGELTVTSVRDKIATGSYVGSPAKAGLLARKKASAQQ